jgi:hypothetical protein
MTIYGPDWKPLKKVTLRGPEWTPEIEVPDESDPTIPMPGQPP